MCSELIQRDGFLSTFKKYDINLKRNCPITFNVSLSPLYTRKFFSRMKE